MHNCTLLTEIKDNLIFPTSSSCSENKRSRIDFLDNLKLLLSDAVSSPSISNNITYPGAFLGTNSRNGRNSVISLLRTLSTQQKSIIQKGTDAVLGFLKTNYAEKEDKIYWAGLTLGWLSEESRIYGELPKYFNSSNIASRTDISDAASLKFNRESLQDLERLIDNISEKSWHDFEYDMLIIILESRNYYLFSPDAYKLFIPAFIRETEGLLSTATNRLFYINLLDLGDFSAYLNSIEARKLELLGEEQKEYIGRYLLLIKKLFEITGDNEEIENLILNKCWQRYVNRPSFGDKAV